MQHKCTVRDWIEKLSTLDSDAILYTDKTILYTNNTVPNNWSYSFKKNKYTNRMNDKKYNGIRIGGAIGKQEKLVRNYLGQKSRHILDTFLQNPSESDFETQLETLHQNIGSIFTEKIYAMKDGDGDETYFIQDHNLGARCVYKDVNSIKTKLFKQYKNGAIWYSNDPNLKSALFTNPIVSLSMPVNSEEEEDGDDDAEIIVKKE